MKRLLVCAVIAGLFVASCSAMDAAKAAFTDAVTGALQNDRMIDVAEVTTVTNAFSTYVEAFKTQITAAVQSRINALNTAAAEAAQKAAAGTAAEQVRALTGNMADALSTAATALSETIEKAEATKG